MPRIFALCVCLSLLLGACSDPEEVETDAGPDTLTDRPAVTRPTEELAEDADLPAVVDAEEYRMAADLVRQHYTAISRGSYRRAFDLWEKGSRDFEEFSREAEQISRAVVTFGSSGRAGTVEGMPTIEVPVTVQITTSDGRIEERHESFLLRKSPNEGWRLLQRTDT